jgi:hypothetical protein
MMFEGMFNNYSMLPFFRKEILLRPHSNIFRVPPELGDRLQTDLSFVGSLANSLVRRLGPGIGFYLALVWIGWSITPLNRGIDWLTPAKFERLIFGNVLALQVQTLRVYFLDCLFNAIYLLHPLYVIFVLAILHKRDPVVFQHFNRATLMTYCLGFAVFLLYPVAPPWLAVEGIENTTRALMNHYSSSWNLPVTYYNFSPAVYAAIPSLHSALAWMSTLCMRKVSKIHGLVMLLFALGVWGATVYTGNHFVVDIVLGILLATVAYRFMGPSNGFYKTMKRWRRVIVSRFR